MEGLPLLPQVGNGVVQTKLLEGLPGLGIIEGRAVVLGLVLHEGDPFAHDRAGHEDGGISCIVHFLGMDSLQG